MLAEHLVHSHHRIHYCTTVRVRETMIIALKLIQTHMMRCFSRSKKSSLDTGNGKHTNSEIAGAVEGKVVNKSSIVSKSGRFGDFWMTTKVHLNQLSIVFQRRCSTRIDSSSRRVEKRREEARENHIENNFLNSIRSDSLALPIAGYFLLDELAVQSISNCSATAQPPAKNHFFLTVHSSHYSSLLSVFFPINSSSLRV